MIVLDLLASPAGRRALLASIKVLCFVLAVVGAYMTGAGSERERLTAIHVAEVANMRQAAAEALATAQAEARAAELEAAKRVNEIEGKYRDEIQNVEAERDRVLADYRDGELRLRDRFQCASGGSVSGAPAGPGGDKPAEGGGLRSSDVRFLVSIAAEADQVVRQLQACQAILKNR